MGGAWERMVQSCKRLIKKAYDIERWNDVHADMQTFHTYLCICESIINERPLYPVVSESKEDIKALRPRDFLIPEPVIVPLSDTVYNVPQPHIKLSAQTPKHAVDQYNLLRNMRHQFYKQWKEEYLVLLQKRVKWEKDMMVTPALKPGDVVYWKISPEMAKDDVIWKLGRVVDVNPDAEGKIRVAQIMRVKAHSRVIKRVDKKRHKAWKQMHEVRTAYVRDLCLLEGVLDGNEREFPPPELIQKAKDLNELPDRGTYAQQFFVRKEDMLETDAVVPTAEKPCKMVDPDGIEWLTQNVPVNIY